MAIKCGWASIGETGKGRGNKAGDQTGKEVKVGAWYNFGQTEVLRWKDRNKAKTYAKVIEKICKNDNVGYDMDDRTTIYTALNAVGWNPDKLTKKVETDCSETVGVGVNCVVGRALVSKSIWTGNLKGVLMQTGLFEVLTDKKYLTSDEYLLTGDIINKPGHHVISALEDGTKTTKTTNLTIAKPTLKKGSKGAEVKKLQKNLNDLGFKDSKGKKLEIDGEFGSNTYFALTKFQQKYKLEIDGIYGIKSESAMKKAYK